MSFSGGFQMAAEVTPQPGQQGAASVSRTGATPLARAARWTRHLASGHPARA